ncbi:uncharacterized protein LOC116011376 isoform X2 [Ipomoea triloba]|uniref:uncharacterized protein LOC116011376 isoform X2 n=1 Tax=Ipomoea triloba TaxID=35885 RepID=UPI00125E2F9F|nr:uncharacterized protein LOC116011376 isoform X2 [Ipomoea triloba]
MLHFLVYDDRQRAATRSVCERRQMSPALLLLRLWVAVADLNDGKCRRIRSSILRLWVAVANLNDGRFHGFAAPQALGGCRGSERRQMSLALLLLMLWVAVADLNDGRCRRRWLLLLKCRRLPWRTMASVNKGGAFPASSLSLVAGKHHPNSVFGRKDGSSSGHREISTGRATQVSVKMKALRLMMRRLEPMTFNIGLTLKSN